MKDTPKEVVRRYKERLRCMLAHEPIPEWAALRKRGRPRKERLETLVIGERKAKLIKPPPPRNTGRPRKLSDDERKEHRRFYNHEYFKIWYARLRDDPVRWKERCDKMNAQAKARKERKRKSKRTN